MSDSKYGKIFTEEDVLALLDELGFGNIQAERYVKTASTHFPDHEPLFIFRGRDKRALGAIMHYRGTCSVAEAEGKVPTQHVDAIDEAVSHFDRFRLEYPDELTEPGQKYRDNNGD